jgi:hypothetical protein
LKDSARATFAEALVAGYVAKSPERKKFVDAVKGAKTLVVADAVSYRAEAQEFVDGILSEIGARPDVGKLGECVGRIVQVSFPIVVLPPNHVARVLLAQSYESWGEPMVERRMAEWVSGRVRKGPKLDDAQTGVEVLLGMNQLWLDMYYELTEWLVKTQVKALQSGTDTVRMASFEDVMYRMLDKDMETILESPSFPDEMPGSKWMNQRLAKMGGMDSKTLLSKARDNLKRGDIFKEEGFEKTVFYVWLVRGPVLRRHFQECVERTVPIAMKVCDAKWERKKD